MSSTIKSDTRSSAGRLTLNNVTAENQKEGQLSEWMTFLQSGGDPRMFLQDLEPELKEQRKVVRVPSMPFGMEQFSDSLSDLDELEDELREEEEEEAKGQRRGKRRTMQEVLEGVINDKEKVMRYKARKDKQEEGEEGFDSEEFDEQELASSSDENQDIEKGSSESDSEDDFQEMLKQAIEESQAQHDPSEVGDRRMVMSEERNMLNNSIEGVLQARHFYPPTLPSQIYLNAQIAEECEHGSKDASMKSTGRWGVKARQKQNQEYGDEHSNQPRLKGKRPKQARPQIHVRNLFQECFDDRHVIETKNRWPVAKGLKPRLFKQAGVSRAYNRHILSRSGVKQSSSVSLTRPNTQNQRFSQASELMPADISLPRNNNEYIAHSKAVQRVGNILQSTEMPPTLSSYFSDMLGQQSKMRKESGAYAIFRNEANSSNEYKAIQGMVAPHREPVTEIVYFQQDSGGPTGRVYRAGLSYRPGTGRSVIVNRNSTMSCSIRGEYSDQVRSRKESGRVSDAINIDLGKKQFIRAQSKGEISGQAANTLRGQDRKVNPFSLAGIHSSPNTIYNSVLRGQGSAASIRLDDSQNYSMLPAPPTAAPPILRPTQYGIGFIPSQSSTSFRGRLTPGMLSKIQPDRDMTPQPAKLNVQNVGGTSNRAAVPTKSQGGGKKVLRIMEDSQRRKKSFQGMQQRVLVPSVVMAERITNSVLKKREPEKREKEGWMPRKSQTRGYQQL